MPARTSEKIRKRVRSAMVNSVAGDDTVYNARKKEPIMSLKSLVATGTKVWSDSVDPKVIKSAVGIGISGATSNPIIIAGIIKGGGFDEKIAQLIDKGLKDSDIAWSLNDQLVKDAQAAFMPVWERTKGDDG